MKVKCLRCSGSGQLPQFKHIQDGVCFHCDGTGMSYPDASQPVNLELVSRIYTLVKIEGGMSYIAQFYVWNTETRAEMFGKGRFFSHAVSRGEKWASPLLHAEPMIFEAPLDTIRAKYKEYLGKGYSVLSDEEFHQWNEENMVYFTDRD